MVSEFSKKDFVKEIHEIELKIAEIDRSINELVKQQINQTTIDEYEVKFNALKAKRNLLVEEHKKISELVKNNYELHRKLTQITEFLKNDDIRDAADIDVFIAKILHRENGSLRFGIKGDGFERLNKEEIMEQLKNNEPFYSSFVTNQLGSINYDMVIIGGNKNV